MNQPSTPYQSRSSRHEQRYGNRWALSSRALFVVAALVVALLTVAWTAGLWRQGQQAQFESEEELMASIGAKPEDLQKEGGEPDRDDSAGDSVARDTAPGLQTEMGNSPPEGGELVVYVSGAVLNPGVVTLPSGSRVTDAVDLVGGPTKKAELNGTNMARHLVDGEQIHIPVLGEATSTSAAPTEQNPPSSPSSEPPCTNINTATAIQLESLPGIGPALSARIVDYREANGPFAANMDLQQVSGIGAKVYSGLEAELCETG